MPRPPRWEMRAIGATAVGPVSSGTSDGLLKIGHSSTSSTPGLWWLLPTGLSDQRQQVFGGLRGDRRHRFPAAPRSNGPNLRVGFRSGGWLYAARSPSTTWVSNADFMASRHPSTSETLYGVGSQLLALPFFLELPNLKLPHPFPHCLRTPQNLDDPHPQMKAQGPGVLFAVRCVR